MELKNQRVLLTGGNGFLGQHVGQKLKERSAKVTVPRSKFTDLRVIESCMRIVKDHDIIIHLAGNVGGIGKNKREPYTLWRDNQLMGLNLLDAALAEHIQKIVIVGTVCEYPKFTPVPFKESDLWAGYPEETNAPYGIAKKSLLVGGQSARQQFGLNVVHLLPVNLYGPGDNFNLADSHVIPALIRKIIKSKEEGLPFIEVWGSGEASREFLYVEDAAEGIVLATENYNLPEPVNLGAGREITISNLVGTLCNILEYKGEIRWNKSQPDGQPRRCLDTSLAEKEFGFRSSTDFRTGLTKTIDWYLNNKNR